MNLQVPRDELPPKEWFTIKSIVRDLELQERDWAADLQARLFLPAFGSLGADTVAAVCDRR